MGGGIMRDHRTNNNATGLTEWEFPLPTLTLVGSKDGLYRVTRAAEGYFHQYLNVDPSQKGRFPMDLLIGGDHGSFMDESMLPSFVVNHDLRPEMSQATAY